MPTFASVIGDGIRGNCRLFLQCKWSNGYRKGTVDVYILFNVATFPRKICARRIARANGIGIILITQSYVTMNVDQCVVCKEAENLHTELMELPWATCVMGYC